MRDLSRVDMSHEFPEVTYAAREMLPRPMWCRRYCFQSIPREPDEWRCHSAVLWDKQVTAVRINVVRYCLAPREMGNAFVVHGARRSALIAVFSNERRLPHFIRNFNNRNKNVLIIILRDKL